MPVSSVCPPDPSAFRWALIRASAILAGVALIGVVFRLSPALHPAALAYALGQGPKAAILFTLGGAVVSGAGAPRQAVAFAGGCLFGVWRGLILSLLAQIIGCVGAFFWARCLGQEWTRALAQRNRFARVDHFLARRPFAATLALRLLPLGNNLALTVLAGLTSMRATPFFVASLLGYIPQSVIFVLLGSGVAVQRGWRIGLGAVLLALSLYGGYAMLRSCRSVPPDPAH